MKSEKHFALRVFSMFLALAFALPYVVFGEISDDNISQDLSIVNSDGNHYEFISAQMPEPDASVQETLNKVKDYLIEGFTVLSDGKEYLIDSVNFEKKSDDSGNTISYSVDKQGIIDSNGQITRQSEDTEVKITVTVTGTNGASLSENFDFVVPGLYNNIGRGDLPLEGECVFFETFGTNYIEGNKGGSLNLIKTSHADGKFSFETTYWTSESSIQLQGSNKIGHSSGKYAYELIFENAKNEKGKFYGNLRIEPINSSSGRLALVALSMNSSDMSVKYSDVSQSGRVRATIIVDQDKETYDFYINGVLAGEDIAMKASGTIDGFRIAHVSAEGKQILHSFKVYKLGQKQTITDEDLAKEDIDSIGREDLVLIPEVNGYLLDSLEINEIKSGANGSVITWSSSNEDIISSDGTVRRGETDTTVTLTATATKNSSRASRTFSFKVPGKTTDINGLPGDITAKSYYSFKDSEQLPEIETSKFYINSNGNDSDTLEKKDGKLVFERKKWIWNTEAAGEPGIYIYADKQKKNIGGRVFTEFTLSKTREVLRGVIQDNSEKELLKFSWEGNTFRMSAIDEDGEPVDLNLTVNSDETIKLSVFSDHTGARTKYSLWINNEKHLDNVYSASKLADGISRIYLSTLVYASYGKNGTYSVDNFGVYSVSDDYTNNPVVPPDTRTDEQKVDAALEIINENNILTVPITSDGYMADPLDLDVYTGIVEGARVSWSTTKPEIIASDGSLIRPETDTEVTLTATASAGDVTKQKSFTFKVPGETTDIAGMPSKIYPVYFDNFSDNSIDSRIKTDRFIDTDTLIEKDGKLTFNRVTWSNTEAATMFYIDSAENTISGEYMVQFTLTKTRDVVRMRMVSSNWNYMSQFYWNADDFRVYYKNDEGVETYKTVNVGANSKAKFTLYTNMSTGKMTIWINNEKVLDNVSYCQNISSIQWIQLYTLNHGSYGKAGNYKVDNFGIYRLLPNMSDAKRVELDAEALIADELLASFAPMSGTLFEDLELPDYGKNGSNITWKSSDTSVITDDGKVTRPSGINKKVTVTATITYKTASTTKEFTYEVLGDNVEIGDRPEIESIIVENDFESDTTNNLIVYNTAGGGTAGIENGKLVLHKTGDGLNQLGATIYNTANSSDDATGIIGISYDLKREKTTTVQIRSMDSNGGLYYSKTWSGNKVSIDCSNDPSVTGTNKRIIVSGDNTIHIDMMFDTANSALWLWVDGKQVITEKYSRQIGVGAIGSTMFYLEYNNRVEIDNYKVYYAIPPKALRLRFDTRDITAQSFYSKDLPIGNTISENLSLPTELRYGTRVEWDSSNDSVISTDGTVNRPLDTEANPRVTLTANYSNSNLNKTENYTYSVLREFSDPEYALKEEVNDIEYAHLTDEEPNRIRKSLNFVEVGPYGSSVTWTSSNQNVITNAGRVIRPYFDEEDATVTVTAHIGSYKKDFVFTVLADEDPVDPMHTSDEDFFGVWNGTTFNKTPQLDYSIEGLSKVQEAAKSGNYTLAKDELYNYFLTRNVSSPIGLSSRIPGWVDARLEGVHELSEWAAYYRGQMTVTSNDYQPVVVSLYNPGSIGKVQCKSFEIIARYNESTAAYILGTDADNPNMVPLLELTVNGAVRTYRATGAATIRAGKYFSTHYGDNKTLTAKMFGDFLGDDTYRILLSFDLSDIPANANISSAQLTVYARKSLSTAQNKQLWLIDCKNDSWNEKTVYWDNLNFALHNYNGLVGGYNWGGARASDVEYRFQAPRFMHMRHAIAEYKYTGDEKYAYLILQQIMDFISDCGADTPYPRSLDAALRMQQWVPLMNNIITSKYLTPEFCTAFLKYMYAQFEYFPSRANVFGDNWREYEQLSVLYATIAYPELSNTKSTQKICIESWENAFGESFLADGVFAEDTGGYSGSVISMYRDFLRTCKNYNIELSDEFINYFKNATYYLSLFKGPNGEALSYGDQGRGKTSSGAYSDLADLFNDYELKFIDSYGSLGTEPSWTSYHFPVGVNTMMRSKWTKDAIYIYTNVRGGGKGHSHADDNSLIVFGNGKTLLADSGKFTYSTYDPARQYGLSTKAHNTVVINDTSQRDMWFGAHPTAHNGTINRWLTNSSFDYLSQTTASYPEHAHTRNVFFIKDGFFVVSDRIVPDNMSASNNYKQYWHMMPEANLTVDSADNKIYSTYTDGKNIILSTADDVNTVMEYGYFDIGDGTPVDNARVGYFEKDVSGVATIDTVAYVTKFPNTSVESEKLETLRPADVTAMKFTVTENGSLETYFYVINHVYDGNGEITFGDYVTDARVALVGLDSEGKVIKAVITDGSYIKKGSQIIADTKDVVTDASISVIGTRIEAVTSDSNAAADNISFATARTINTAKFNGEGKEFTKAGDLISLSSNAIDETKLPSDNNKHDDIIVPDSSTDPGNSGQSGGAGGSSGGGQTGTGAEVDTPVETLPFSDISSHWAKEYIVLLQSMNVVNGNTNGTYEPDRDISRCEFASIAIRAIGAVKTDYRGEFADVTNDDWFANDLQTAVDLGIISKDTAFRPNEKITRQEMAKILTQCAKYLKIAELEAKSLDFNDSHTISSWAAEYIEYVVSNNLMNGKDGKLFDPMGKATRAETATVFARLISK